MYTSVNSNNNLFKHGQLINLADLRFKLTGKFSSPRKGEEGPGLSYVPPCTLSMQNNSPQKFSTGIEESQTSQLPESFSWNNDDDVRSHKGDELVGIIQSPSNQLTCGGCWAFAATTALSDRIAIGQGVNPMLGPTYLMSYGLTLDCNQDHLCGCNGGIISNALESMAKPIGTVPSDCWSYEWCVNGCDKSGDGDKNNSLIPNFSNSSKCVNSSTPPFVYKVEEGSVNTLTTLDQIKTQVFNKGPTPTGYFVFTDFFMGTAPESQGGDGWKATNGIYVHLDTDDSGKTPAGDETPYKYGTPNVMNTLAGAHAVVIVGWGVEEVPNFLKKSLPKQDTFKLPYWVVRNSWGDKWNNGGFFKIACTDEKYHINTTVGFDSAKGGVGGVIDFDADLKSAPPPDNIGSKKRKRGKKDNTIWWIIFGILGAIVLVFIIWHLWQRFSYLFHNVRSEQHLEKMGDIRTIHDGQALLEREEGQIASNIQKLSSRVQSLRSKTGHLNQAIKMSDMGLSKLESNLQELSSKV